VAAEAFEALFEKQRLGKFGPCFATFGATRVVMSPSCTA
jgi:hypothetical protein